MNGDRIRVSLLPAARSLELGKGESLADALFTHGVEFPCGGHGRCKGCRVRVLAGDLPVTPDDARALTAADLSAGWRLACRAQPGNDLTLEVGQWEAAILSDDSALVFAPRSGLGVAVDVGTTTLVAQLVDLPTGRIRGVRTALNAQSRYGGDIMSRVEHALASGGREELSRLIRQQVGSLIGDLLASATRDSGVAADDLRDVVLVGNTVMHHLFAGLEVEVLSRVPFEPVHPGTCRLTGEELGWPALGDVPVRFLPCLGGFVGSDLLAGLMATRLPEAKDLTALVDLGTNGEMIVGCGGRLLCASTAAGPAFEGARITQGMRAVTGAISEVSVVGGEIACRVLGGGPARGLCGSGLVDAVAVGLGLGRIDATGRMTGGARSWRLAPGVELQQADIRELQLAKGAVAAGLRLLLESWGAKPRDLVRVYLAGAFGNYINRASAQRIGLLNVPPERVTAAGNTALLGAKMALYREDDAADDWRDLRASVHHVALGDDPKFADIFADEMCFPSEDTVS